MGFTLLVCMGCLAKRHGAVRSSEGFQVVFQSIFEEGRLEKPHNLENNSDDDTDDDDGDDKVDEDVESEEDNDGKAGGGDELDGDVWQGVQSSNAGATGLEQPNFPHPAFSDSDLPWAPHFDRSTEQSTPPDLDAMFEQMFAEGKWERPQIPEFDVDPEALSTRAKPNHIPDYQDMFAGGANDDMNASFGPIGNLHQAVGKSMTHDYSGEPPMGGMYNLPKFDMDSQLDMDNRPYFDPVMMENWEPPAYPDIDDAMLSRMDTGGFPHPSYLNGDEMPQQLSFRSGISVFDDYPAYEIGEHTGIDGHMSTRKPLDCFTSNEHFLDCCCDLNGRCQLGTPIYHGCCDHLIKHCSI